jgi:hypothetical protein
MSVAPKAIRIKPDLVRIGLHRMLNPFSTLEKLGLNTRIIKTRKLPIYSHSLGPSIDPLDTTILYFKSFLAIIFAIAPLTV